MSEALETLQRHHVLWFVLAGAALFAWSRWRDSRKLVPRATGISTGRDSSPTAHAGTEDRDSRPATLSELGAQFAELEARRSRLTQQIASLEDEPASAGRQETVSVGAGKRRHTRGRGRRSRQTPE